MFRFMRKAKGSISIFLCLIMLPMVTYSTMIIDASRLQAAKASIASAGDLTMNAAMSEYEQILQDMYGLFAVAQSEDDLKPALKAYFKQTIEGQIAYGEGDEEDYVGELADELVTAIFENGGEDPETVWSNFLEMKIDEFNYTPVNGSALANPAVMKRQVIDYMKYKGPVSLVCTLFRKLNFLKNSSKQADAVEKKIEYTKKLSDIEDPCLRAYYALFGNEEDGTVGFNKLAKCWNEEILLARGSDILESRSFSSVQDITVFLNWAKEYYRAMTASRILDESKPDLSGFTYDSLKNETSAADYSSIRDLSENTAGDCAYKLDQWINKRNEIVNPTNDDGGAFEQKVGRLRLNDSGGSYLENVDPDDSNCFPVLSRIVDGGSWKSVLDEEFNEGDSIETAKTKQIAHYNLQKKIYDGKADLAQYIRWREDYNTVTDAIDSLYNTYYDKRKEEFKNENRSTARANVEEDVDMDGGAADLTPEAYEEMLSAATERELDRMWDEEVNNESSAVHQYRDKKDQTVNARNVLNDNFNTAFTNFLEKLRDVSMYSSYANKFESDAYGFLCPLYVALLGMQDDLEVVDTALQEVLDAIDDLQAAKEDWQTSIDGVEEGATRTSMQNDLDTMTEGIDEEDVTALKTKAGELKSKVDAMISELETVKYLGQQICREASMGDFDDLVTHGWLDRTIYNLIAPDDTFPCPPDFSSVSTFRDNALADGDDGSVAFTKAEALDSEFDTSGVHSSTFVLIEELEGRPEDDDPREKFVDVLKDIANPVESQPMDSNTQEQYDQISSDAGNVSDSGTPSSSSADSLDSSEDAEEVEQSDPASEDIGGFLSDIRSYQDDYEESLGDLDPSSYAVSGMELPDSDDDDADPGASLSAAKKLLQLIADIGTEIRDTAYMEEYFTELFTCRTDKLRNANVILLNGYTNQEGAAKQLNTNTEWYGKEVEFIIWGDSDLDANLVKNDAMIFAIRFALNAIYAFTAADIQSFALEVATAIAGWTVIGVPIVQACITLGIALAESAWDLHLLHQGKDVAIYKNATSFVCSPTGALTNIVSSAVTDAANWAIENGASYLEEQIDEAIDGLHAAANETVADYADDLEDTVDDFIDEQAEQIRASIERTLITPLVNKLMAVPQMHNVEGMTVSDALSTAIDEAFSAISTNVGNMPAGKMRDIAQDFITNQSGALKTALLNRLTSTFEEALGDGSATTGIDANAIRKALVNRPAAGSTEPTGLITEALDSFSERIKESLADVKEQMMENFRNATDVAAGNMKDYFHEQMSAASEMVSSSVSNYVSSLSGGSSPIEIDSVSSSGGFTLNYKEYCKIFVLLNAAANETKMLQRAGALIQANVRNPQNEDMANGSFEMIAANTLVSVHANMKLGTLFPWCVSDEIDETTGDDSLALDFSNLGGRSVTINYNGINGY